MISTVFDTLEWLAARLILLFTSFTSIRPPLISEHKKRSQFAGREWNRSSAQGGLLQPPGHRRLADGQVSGEHVSPG